MENDSGGNPEHQELSNPIMTQAINRTVEVFEHTTTEAQIGDYFRLPYQPTFRVIALVDLGDIVSYLVQSGGNTPEQWDIQKPAAEIAKQERNRVEAEEIEMFEIIHIAPLHEVEDALSLLMPLETVQLASPLEISEVLGVLIPPRYDWNDNRWLTEPVGAGLDYIFGMDSQEQADYLPPVENAYHDPNWTADGCEF